MSYGGSNPPWQRSALGAAGQQNAIPTIQSQLINSNLVGYPTNQTIYGQNIGMGQQQNAVAAMIPQMGTNMNTMNASLYTQTVQYPNTRGLNPAAFGPSSGPQHTQQQQQQQQQYGQPSVPQTCGRVGVVTKFSKDYGFVDDEILFHKNVCKGVPPKVGDRVLVEASYSSTSAFKWNATMIQMLGGPVNNQMNTGGRSQQQQSTNNSSSQRNGSGYKAVPPPNNYAGGVDRPSHRSENSHGGAVSPSHSSRRRNRSRDLDIDIEDRRKKREREREREKDRKKDRSRERREPSSERRERNRSPVRYLSPKREKKDGKIRRYRVQMPKVSLNM